MVDSGPRWKGVRSFAKSSDLELDQRLILDLPESRDPISSFEAGYKLTEELIKQKRPFTALMAFDDMTAFGAIRALNKAGIRVPEHCSVIGFDDVATSAFYTPALTTIRQPLETMGAMAVEIVVDGINGALEKREITAFHRQVAPELVVRESTHKSRVNILLLLRGDLFLDSAPHCGKAFFQVGNQIIHVFDSDRQADELLGHSHLFAFFGTNHGVGRDDRNGDQ